MSTAPPILHIRKRKSGQTSDRSSLRIFSLAAGLRRYFTNSFTHR